MKNHPRNTSSLEWVLEQITGEMKHAGIFLGFENQDEKAKELVNSVLALAQTPMTGTINGVTTFAATVCKFTISLEISEDDEVTVSDIGISYPYYSPLVSLNPNVDLDGKLKQMVGLGSSATDKARYEALSAEIDNAVAERIGNLSDEWNRVRVQSIKEQAKGAYIKPSADFTPVKDAMRYYNEHAKTELGLNHDYLKQETGQSDPNEALLQFAQNLSGLSREELIARFY